MRVKKRAPLALAAATGLVAATMSVTAVPATAGGQVAADWTMPEETAPTAGVLDNGVEWSVDRGAPHAVQGYNIFSGTQTWSFGETVDVTFSIAGLNCAGEAMRVPESATLVSTADGHVWDADTATVTGGSAADPGAASVFQVEGVTSFTLQAISAASCGRGVSAMTVSAFRNAAPTATIAAPVDGATFLQGQVVPAAYSCADADADDDVDCVGDVAVGQPIDTSTLGTHTFEVTATDEHGASSSTTATYTVGEQTGMCSGRVIGLPLNIDLVEANPATTPCATDGRALLKTKNVIGDVLPGLLRSLSPTIEATLLEATSSMDGTVASGSATVDEVTIAYPLTGQHMILKDLWSEASADASKCGTPEVTEARTDLATMILNGKRHERLKKPGSLALPGLGGVYLNDVRTSGSSVTARAVFVDLPGNLLDVVVGESKAGVVC